MADGVGPDLYRVGGISQALSGKKTKGNAGAGKLSVLFSSGISSEPLFVPVAAIKPKAAADVGQEEDATKKKRKRAKLLEDAENEGQEGEIPGNLKRNTGQKRRMSSEANQLASTDKRRKVAKKPALEEPERLERTVFVGNLPVTFTHKKLKKLFKMYGEVESVRFRSAALMKANMSRKIGMIKKEFHKDRHNFNGYVVFKEKESAEKALASDGQEVDGFHMRVDLVRNTKQHDHKRSVFVGNLPFDTEEEPLRNLFSSCGDVEAVRLVRDSVTGMGKGFGFILFKSKDAVTFALKMNKTEFRGRSLRVFPSSANPGVDSGKIKKLKKGRPVAYSFSGLIASKKDQRKHGRHRTKQPSLQANQKRSPSSVNGWTRNKGQQHSARKSKPNKWKGDTKTKNNDRKGPRQFTRSKTSNSMPRRGKKSAE